MLTLKKKSCSHTPAADIVTPTVETEARRRGKWVVNSSDRAGASASDMVHARTSIQPPVGLSVSNFLHYCRENTTFRKWSSTKLTSFCSGERGFWATPANSGWQPQQTQAPSARLSACVLQVSIQTVGTVRRRRREHAVFHCLGSYFAPTMYRTR